MDIRLLKRFYWVPYMPVRDQLQWRLSGGYTISL